jgi:serine protease Do
MNSLLKTGKVVRGWLGVVIQQVDRDLAKAMKLPTHKGVLVADLDPKGPAKKAGLKRGDLLVRINGKKVASTGKLRNLVAAAGSGAQVTLELYRAGKKRSLSVKLAELPGQLGRSPGKGEAPGRAGGLSVAPLDSTVRNRFNIPSKVKRGVVVTGLRRDSAAARGGLRPGDVILELNRVRINSVRRFSKLYSATRGQVLLLIFRGGFSQYLLIHK